MFSEDSDLYFGTADGRICKFNDTDHIDKSFEVVEAGDMSFHPSTDNVIYNSSLVISEENLLEFQDTTLFEMVFNTDDVVSMSIEHGIAHIALDYEGTGTRWENLALLNEGDSFYLVGDVDPSTAI